MQSCTRIINGNGDLENSLPPSNPTKVRVISGVILGGIVLGLLLLGEPYIYGLIAVAVMGMAREWCRMIGNQSKTVFVVYCLILFTFLGLWQYGYNRECLVGLCVFSLALYCGGIALQQRVVRWLAVGLVYLGIPIISVLWLLAQHSYGAMLVLWIISIIVANDTCAYFTGRTLGGPKLAPSISPGKTWSGLAGGITGALVLGWATALYHGSHEIFVVAMAGITALMGNMGDLLESAVKRHFGVKDTGASIPGHGGVLDRCDSFIGATPIVTLFLWLGAQGILGDAFRAFVLSL